MGAMVDAARGTGLSVQVRFVLLLHMEPRVILLSCSVPSKLLDALEADSAAQVAQHA